MINQTIIYLPHTDCNHPKLKPYAKELGINVNWDPDLSLGIPLTKIFNQVIRYDVGSDYASIGVRQTNQKIIDLVGEHKPKYVIWPTMNYEIQEETFQKIRQLGSYVVGWFFDDECRFDEYSRWWIPYMDYFLTCDLGSIHRYQELGGKALHLPVTADPDYFKPVPSTTTYDISFIGSRTVADRDNLIEQLATDGISISTFGKGWDAGFVTNEEMLQIYSNSKINICFTKSYGVNTRNQLKKKIFDITMCGGFLLCEYVDGIEKFYEIGKEIVCFNSYPDALDKVRYYLHNDQERKQIAQAGMLRATTEYSQQALLKKVFNIIETDTAFKTKRVFSENVQAAPPETILKLKEQYHTRWAQVLQETGFEEWRIREEKCLANCYRLPGQILQSNNTRIVLVQPTYPSSPFPGPNLPVGLGYIAEQLELNNIHYEVIDLSIDSLEDFFSQIAKTTPEYIALSMMSLDANNHYGLLTKIKKQFPWIKIVAGGAHISFIQEKALQDCHAIDFGVVHEGEHTLIELLNGDPFQGIKGLIYRDHDGTVIYTGNRHLIDNLDQLAFPRYDKFKLSRYGETLAIASSRGCPFSCTFCGAFLSMGRKWRARSVWSVIEELEYWQQRGYTSFNFIDSNFFMSKQRVIDLCDSLASMHISITLSSDGMRAKDADPVMLTKLKQFGLQSVAIGIESANDDILNSIKKGETLADLESCLQTMLNLDINVVAFFIIGLPGETVQHVLNSFAFALKYPNISSAYFFNPNPLPGTELYSYVEQHQMLRATESQILDNIGGMGNQILLETEELPVSVRRKLLELSHHVSQLVGLRHRLHREQNSIADSDRLNIENEMQSINSKINQSIAMLNEPINCIELPMTKYENIFTHLTYEEKYKLQELANTTRGTTYVEIGSYLGASSCFIASGIQLSGIAAKLYCIDTWNNDAMSEGNRNTGTEFSENTEAFKDIIVPLRGRSEEVAKTFDKEIDFLFIDAGHEYDDVKADILAWFPKLRPGALVIFHDIGWAEGVQRIVKEYIQPIACNEGLLPNMYWANINTSILLSVIIPTRNRATLLYNTLESLTSQTYPATSFEVIIVDNGSTDSTAEVCKHFERRFPQFKRIYDPRPGLHNGRHTGLEAANGDILVYADDDIEALPTWLEGIAESFVDPSVALVGGKILPKFECPPPEWIDLLSARTDSGWSLGWYSLLDFGDTAHEIPHEYVWGCNFSIRKDVLKKVGGFHPDSVPQELIKYRGDGETAVSFAVRDLGLKAMYNPKAAVFHVVSSNRLTVDYIYQRAFNQGVSESYTQIRLNRALSSPMHYASPSDTIHETVSRGMVDGFNYHQQMVQVDRKLQEWVLRDNYFGENGVPQ